MGARRPPPVLVLSRADVLELLSLRECIDAVEGAFRGHAAGRTLGPGVLEVPAADGGFHVKAAALVGERGYFAAKTNANFPGNAGRFGLPTIQRVVVLIDARTGEPLAVIESGSVTALRTAAATGVAARLLARRDARLLARRDARTATIVGCGVQGELRLAALAAVLPLRRARVVDLDPGRAERLATRAEARLGLEVQAVADSGRAVRESDVCVTCTPSRRPLLGVADVGPGTFVAAVGADARGKQELDPALLPRATGAVDVLAQCAEIGELPHALAAGLMTRDAVHAELHEVVAGRRPGRRTAEEITVFDSCGTALADVAAAAVVEKARATGRGTAVRLDG